MLLDALFKNYDWIDKLQTVQGVFSVNTKNLAKNTLLEVASWTFQNIQRKLIMAFKSHCPIKTLKILRP